LQLKGALIDMKLKVNVTNPIAFIVVAALGVVLNIAFWGAVIWIAWHFISKLW
jgi:hypothetical protein